MRQKKFLFPVVLMVLLLLMLLGVSIIQAGPPNPPPVPLKGLKERPDLPVRSVHLRQNLPDHPHGGPPGQGEPGGGGCDKGVDLTSTLAGVVAVAAQNNTICTSADIDTYVRNGSTYVVQASGEEAAWTHTDVSNPANPVIRGQFVWDGAAGRNTYTPDVKYFRQGANDYIALSLERQKVRAFCGVAIVNVTNPANPVIESQATGSDWCDVHNTFVEDDGNGNGQYIYLTADGPNDMRVLDISGAQEGSVSNPVEIGRYTSPAANNDNYVHDITVINHGGAVGRRAYLAYWDTGLVVLNAAGVTPGTNPTPIIGPNQLDPPGFLNHHSFPTQDGNYVFIQDEFLSASGAQPVQMWNVSNPASPAKVDGLTLGSDVPANPAHNLEIRYDINASRLYVGWYKLGLQAWDFTGSGFVRSNPTPRTAVQYHQAQTEAADDAYDGAWGVRLENIGANLYIFQSDRRYGLIVDCVSCATPTPTPTATATPTPAPTATPGGGTGTIKGTVTAANTGAKLGGVLVTTDTGQSATTNNGGKYTINNVPAGSRTVTASKTGYVTQQQPATVTAGQTTTVNFALVPQ